MLRCQMALPENERKPQRIDALRKALEKRTDDAR
jgi:hypothetical protein